MAPVLVKSLKELDGLLPSTDLYENLRWCIAQAHHPACREETSEEAQIAFKLYSWKIGELSQAQSRPSQQAPPIPPGKPKFFPTATNHVPPSSGAPNPSGLDRRPPPVPSYAPSPSAETATKSSYTPIPDQQPHEEVGLFISTEASRKPKVALPAIPQPQASKVDRPSFERPPFSRSSFEHSPHHHEVEVKNEQEEDHAKPEENRQKESPRTEDDNVATKEAETAVGPRAVGSPSSSNRMDMPLRIKPAAPVEKREDFAAKAVRGLPSNMVGKTLKMFKAKEPKSPELWTRSTIIHGENYIPFPPVLKDDLEGLNRHGFDESQKWPDKRAIDHHGNPVFHEPELRQYLVKDDTVPKRKGTRLCLSIAHARMTYHPRLLEEPQRLKQFHEDHGIYIKCRPCHDGKHDCDHGRPCSHCKESKQTCKYVHIAGFKFPPGPPPMLCKFGVTCFRAHSHVINFFNWCQMVFSEHGSEVEDKPLFVDEEYAWQEKCDWSTTTPWPDEYQIVPASVEASSDMNKSLAQSKVAPTAKPATALQAVPTASLRPPDRGHHRKLGEQ